MNRRCTIRFSDTWKSEIEAILLEFVSTSKIYGPQQLTGTNLGSNYTKDALVQLVTFDQGSIYQIPLNLVKMVGKFENERYEKYYLEHVHD